MYSVLLRLGATSAGSGGKVGSVPPVSSWQLDKVISEQIKKMKDPNFMQTPFY
ncbi:hypothetical Protein YC6258_01720 [Gynuella sunshinyii YC6258]|uniref:Uncharacterized protein n=1 Tax=Gynuella sunshinyii YC6258 TaxID=1445510 RepID=A0A0C5VK86_9GAMM|nr:hypothetical Protein YC6258_01720 [Gynuella sunshinyii YC6258]